MNILAIESSCDETAAAVVKDGRTILSNEVASQIEIHALYGGVVPEIASRAHTEAISSLTQNALKNAGLTIKEIDAVAVTCCPGLIGDLLVGVNFAKGLAYSNSLPLIPVHHIKGHVAANYLYYNRTEQKAFLEPPFTALVISGGHTSLMNFESYTECRILGSTRDDAAGEAFDKVARLMSLPYPGGAKLDKLAFDGNENAVDFPIAHRLKDNPYDFSFSGLKTAAVNYLHTCDQKKLDVNRADVAASFTKAVVKTIVSRVEPLLENRELFSSGRLVLAGGVSANSHIRAALSELCKKHGAELFVPPLSLCGDNAAMIGSQGFYEYTLAGKTADISQNAFATMGADEF